MVRQSAANSDTKANDTVSTLSAMVGQIRTVYAGASDYTKVTPANLISAGLVVQPLTVVGTTITDPWSNPVNFAGNTAYFALSIKVQDKSACIKVTSTLASNALQVTDSATDPLAAAIPATGFATPTIKDMLPATQKPYDPAAAATACGKTGQFIAFLYR